MRRFLLLLALVALTTAQTAPPPTFDSLYFASWWQPLAPGLEHGIYRPPGGAELHVVRIDPTRYRFRVHYHPGAPQTLDGWRAELDGAAAFVNASFFTSEHTILGVAVIDGVVYGRALVNQGGMFQVIGDAVRVRSTRLEPYQSGEPLDQAVQAYPMLVVEGEALIAERTRNEQTRRTVVAQDRRGHILLLATAESGLTLNELASYLAHTDLDIDNALNLDGGSSTMLYLTPPGLSVESRVPVPAVLAVYPADSRSCSDDGAGC